MYGSAIGYSEGIKKPNAAPIADKTRLVKINTPVLLDASNSTDPDNSPNPLTYQWNQIKGPAITLSNSTSPKPTFTPTTSNEWWFELTISDGAASSKDTAKISTTWQQVDIGNPGASGSVYWNGTVFYIYGGGGNTSGTSDKFTFVCQPITGDGELVVYVTDISNYDGVSGALSGAMIRESLASGSSFASMFVSPYYEGNAFFKYRTTTGTSISSTTNTGVVIPYWIKIKRVGSSFTGWKSANGSTWVQVGPSVTMTMASTVYFGMAVTSNSSTQTATSHGKTGTSGVSVTSNPPITVTVNDQTIGTGLNQFQFSGFNSETQSGNYNNDGHWSWNVLNENYQVRFYGTQVKIYTKVENCGGIAGVSIDGGTEILVDKYSPTTQFQKLIYTSPVLTLYNHTLKVRNTNTKNANSIAACIYADRVDIVSGGISNTAPTVSIAATVSPNPVTASTTNL